jgi:signal transduction histidine kinase
MNASPDRREPRRIRGAAWPLAATLALLALYLTADVLFPARLQGAPLEWLLVLRLLIEAAAYLVAAARRALPRRLRQGLGLLGVICLGSAMVAVCTALDSAPPGSLHRLIYDGWALLSYPLAVVACLLFPMMPFRPGEWRTFALDLLISVGGFASVVLFTQLAPLTAFDPIRGQGRLELYGLFTGASMMFTLNLLTVRRKQVPSARAFWWFMSSQASYLAMGLVYCVLPAHPLTTPLGDGFHDLAAVFAVWCAWAMRSDPITTRATTPSHWLRRFNPFALAMPAVVAWASVLVGPYGMASARTPLAITSGIVASLLVMRLVLTILERERADRDLQRQEREALESRRGALKRFAGGVSHVVNNQLTVILGQAGLEAQEPHALPVREAFTVIERSAEQAAAMSRRLLWATGSQFRSGTPIALDDWLDTWAAHAPLPPGGTHRIERVRGAPGTRVRIDPEPFGEALGELVRNAVEAMPAGGVVTLASAIEEGNPPGDRTPPRPMAHLTVRDTGTGIAPADLPRVTEPFFTTRGLARAQGLGLTTAEGIVEAHQGAMRVESALGTGTSVHLWLPVEGD